MKISEISKKKNKLNAIQNILKPCQHCSLNSENRLAGHGCISPDIVFLVPFITKTNIIVDQAITGDELRILKVIFKEAQQKAKVQKKLTAYYLNTVLCEYTGYSVPDKRVPLICSKNIVRIVKILSPKLIVFVGEYVKENYKRIYVDGVRISNPEIHLVYGGKGSPLYLTDVKTLSNSIKDMV